MATNQDEDEEGGREVVPMPSPRALSLKVLGHLAEAVAIPLGLFYVVNVLVDLRAALIAAAGWAGCAIAFHLLRGARPTALLGVTAALAAIQLLVTAATSSAMVYFLQPTLATFVFALAFAVTAHRRGSLLEHLSQDFCPMPSDVIASTTLQRLFRTLSYLWGSVLAVNSGLTLALLLTLPTTFAVPLATGGSLPVFFLGLYLSYRWFRRAIHAGGYVLVWGGA